MINGMTAAEYADAVMKLIEDNVSLRVLRLGTASPLTEFVTINLRSTGKSEELVFTSAFWWRGGEVEFVVPIKNVGWKAIRESVRESITSSVEYAERRGINYDEIVKSGKCAPIQESSVFMFMTSIKCFAGMENIVVDGYLRAVQCDYRFQYKLIPKSLVIASPDIENPHVAMKVLLDEDDCMYNDVFGYTKAEQTAKIWSVLH